MILEDHLIEFEHLLFLFISSAARILPNKRLVNWIIGFIFLFRFLGKPLDSNFPCQSAAQIGVSEGRKFVDCSLGHYYFNDFLTYIKVWSSWLWHLYEAEEGEDYLKYEEAISPSIKLSKDDFESIPSYMKSLASWEVRHYIIPIH